MVLGCQRGFSAGANLLALNISRRPLRGAMTSPQHTYEVRPRRESSRCRSDLRCATIRSPLVRRAGRSEQRNRGYAKFPSRSLDAAIRVYDEAANVIEKL